MGPVEHQCEKCGAVWRGDRIDCPACGYTTDGQYHSGQRLYAQLRADGASEYAATRITLNLAGMEKK